MTENVIKIVLPFILFILGIAYKLFELKYTRKREIQENEDLIKNWITSIKTIHSNYITNTKKNEHALRDIDDSDVEYILTDLLVNVILDLNKSNLYNYYITNREIKKTEYNHYRDLYFNFLYYINAISKNQHNYKITFDKIIELKSDFENKLSNLYREFDNLLFTTDKNEVAIREYLQKITNDIIIKSNTEENINKKLAIAINGNKDGINYLNASIKENYSEYRNNLLRTSTLIDVEFELFKKIKNQYIDQLFMHFKVNENMLNDIQDTHSKLISNKIKPVYQIK